MWLLKGLAGTRCVPGSLCCIFEQATAGCIYLLHAFVLTTIHRAADHIPDATRVFTCLAASDGVHRQPLGKLTA